MKEYRFLIQDYIPNVPAVPPGDVFAEGELAGEHHAAVVALVSVPLLMPRSDVRVQGRQRAEHLRAVRALEYTK